MYGRERKQEETYLCGPSFVDTTPSSIVGCFALTEPRRGKNSRASSVMVGVAGVTAVIELLRVRVLAELVLASLLRWISCGFVPLFSIWPSCDHPSAEKAPFRISGSVGILDPTSPVACHMPNGGLLFRKLSRNDAPLVLRAGLAVAETSAGLRS